MKPFALVICALILSAGLVFAAAEERVTLHLGDPKIENMGKLREGNQIGVRVASPPGTHIVGVSRTTDSSPWVHSCDEHEVNGTKCEWRDGVDKVGSSAYQYLPGTPHNIARWLGWTDSGDKAQAFTLVIYSERGP
jgi:hypothetical protein